MVERKLCYNLFMAALCNRGAIIFCPVVSFYLSSIYLLSFFPRLISAAVDRMSAILLQLNPSVQKPYKCTFSEIEKNAFKVVFTITF